MIFNKSILHAISATDVVFCDESFMSDEQNQPEIKSTSDFWWFIQFVGLPSPSRITMTPDVQIDAVWPGARLQLCYIFKEKTIVYSAELAETRLITGNCSVSEVHKLRRELKSFICK